MTFNEREELKEQLVRHEGLRLKPYLDTAVPPRMTIGCGRNLTDRGISHATAEQMLEEDIDLVLSELEDKLPFFEKLDPVRQRVLADMCFNLGIGGLLGFHNTLKLVEEGKFDAAATNMLLSRWSQQVGPRAHTLARMMREGK
jgi:lysozyme